MYLNWFTGESRMITKPETKANWRGFKKHSFLNPPKAYSEGREISIGRPRQRQQVSGQSALTGSSWWPSLGLLVKALHQRGRA